MIWLVLNRMFISNDAPICNPEEKNMNTGIYCDIKRYAIHDGPGIRTTLFLKGCPLHCVWCHNPETISPESEIALRKNKCINCGECASACPQNVHVLRLNGHLLSRKKCTGCGKCDHVCYYNALAFYGRKITVDEAFTELIKDREFFEESAAESLSPAENRCCRRNSHWRC